MQSDERRLDVPWGLYAEYLFLNEPTGIEFSAILGPFSPLELMAHIWFDGPSIVDHADAIAGRVVIRGPRFCLPFDFVEHFPCMADNSRRAHDIIEALLRVKPANTMEL